MSKDPEGELNMLVRSEDDVRFDTVAGVIKTITCVLVSSPAISLNTWKLLRAVQADPHERRVTRP